MPARSALRAAAAAPAFLTQVPVGRLATLGPDDVARGAVLFPAVGAGIGALVGGVAVGLDSRMTLLLAAALAVAVEALVTGGIHLDALADTADGLGAPTRERALEIMREPAIGSFGAAAVALGLLVKTAALAALLDGPDPILAATAAFALGRVAPLALSWTLPYARASGGTGASLATGARAPWLAAGLLLGVGIAVAALGLSGLWLAAGAAVAVVAVGLVARRRFGGVTGDVLGAAVELGTTFALVAAAATR